MKLLETTQFVKRCYSFTWWSQGCCDATKVMPSNWITGTSVFHPFPPPLWSRTEWQNAELRDSWWKMVGTQTQTQERSQDSNNADRRLKRLTAAETKADRNTHLCIPRHQIGVASCLGMCRHELVSTFPSATANLPVASRCLCCPDFSPVSGVCTPTVFYHSWARFLHSTKTTFTSWCSNW